MKSNEAFKHPGCGCVILLMFIIWAIIIFGIQYKFRIEHPIKKTYENHRTH